jgi:O-acetyl-ADP-ribose deacetylase
MSQVSDRISIVQGDITQQDVDAIVNAANETLLGGGGVDGAIHRAAGAELLVACKALNGCPTGEARVTPGFNLPAKWVIHTVGPRYSNPRHATLLRNCYINSISAAIKLAAAQVAFPAISTGVYGYPIASATEVAFDTVLELLTEKRTAQDLSVVFVCFSQSDYATYCAEFRKQFGEKYQGE